MPLAKLSRATGPPRRLAKAVQFDAAAAELAARYRVLADRLRPRRTDIALCMVVAVAGIFYEWTAQTSIAPGAVTPVSTYYLLAGAFLHLHLYLPIGVPPGLLALPNPYNPVANASYQAQYGLHDLALYHHLLYSTWGPTPAIVFYLPLRLLGISLSDATAVPLCSFAALMFAVLLLRLTVRRFLPATRGWALVLGAIALAFGTAIPFVLRRPAIYEVAITCGAAFMLAALYLLARGLLDGPTPRLRLLTAASLCAGLAFGSRPPLLLGGAVFFGVAVVFWRRPMASAMRRRIVTALLGPLALCVLLMGAYNYDRFGSPTQFGLSYQLAGEDTQLHSAFELDYILPGAYNFALAPPRLALTFPHVFLPPPPGYPGTLPHGYDGTTQAAEPTGGVIPMAPIVLFALIAPILWRRRGRLGSELPAIVAILALLGLAILLGLSFTLWGTTERYEVDFDVVLILAGVLAWLGLRATIEARRRRRVVTALGVVAIAWSCLTGVAVSFTGYYGALQAYHPGLFDQLEDLTGPLATLPTMLIGHAVIANVESPEPTVNRPINYTTIDKSGVSTYLGGGPVTLVVLSPDSGSLAVRIKASANMPFPLWMTVQSGAQQSITVRLRRGINRLPIHVSWGLNRITLDDTSSDPRNIIIGMGDISLVGRDG
jgi:hypothetical protein